MIGKNELVLLILLKHKRVEIERFGARRTRDQKTSDEEALLLRLHLLLVMVKAALKGYPIGNYRKKAALDNASAVYRMISKSDLSFLHLNTTAHLLKERVKLLSVMTTAIISDDYPLGIHRREAVLDNIEVISTNAFHKKNLRLFPEVLKVA